MKPKMECMMKHIGRYLAVMLCLALAMSLLAGFMPGVMSTAKAEGETTFNIAVSGNTFTVTRSGDTSKAQTIIIPHPPQVFIPLLPKHICKQSALSFE